MSEVGCGYQPAAATDKNECVFRAAENKVVHVYLYIYICTYVCV